jgi:hypothetical protein
MAMGVIETSNRLQGSRTFRWHFEKDSKKIFLANSCHQLALLSLAMTLAV